MSKKKTSLYNELVRAKNTANKFIVAVDKAMQSGSLIMSGARNIKNLNFRVGLSQISGGVRNLEQSTDRISSGLKRISKYF